MSTNLLYKAFGVRGQIYRKTEYVDGEVHFYAGLKPRHIRCPLCKTRQVTRHGGSYRPLWTLPIGSTPVKLLVWYECPISTGPVEGTNIKIKTLRRQADGYRDQEYVRLLIFACQESRCATVVSIR